MAFPPKSAKKPTAKRAPVPFGAKAKKPGMPAAPMPFMKKGGKVKGC